MTALHTARSDHGSLSDLPSTPDAFADASWDNIAPFYDRLESANLDIANASAWLGAWSRLEELVGEAGTQSMIAYTGDTSNPKKEAAYLRFSSEIFPRIDERQVRLARRILVLGFRHPDLETVLTEWRTDSEIFRTENVALFSEIEELSARYQKITGTLEVEFDGERKTIPELQPYLKLSDRTVRERAYLARDGAYLSVRGELSDVFDRMLELRNTVARNAGFDNYHKYAFKAKHRFEYTPSDCARFHAAVEDTVVPAVERQLAYRRQRLGVESVRPWDLGVDPDSAKPLVPFTDVPDFVARARGVFGRVDAELGAQFGIMADESLLDLASRSGKAPGGYCTKLSFRRRPFIFMNAVGVPDDVATLMHEAGHCFHAFLGGDHPFIWQRGTGSEAAELASMTMELFAAPLLAKPEGYYDPDDLRRARIEHLEDILFSLAHIASVDAFQAWIYSRPEARDRDARDAAWLEIRARFERGIDWSGLEVQRAARWYRQLHIFEDPFYYIEYGIAQLGALQIWRDSLRDPAGAVSRYKRALALGGTRPLREIYSTAGAGLVFDAREMGELVSVVESVIGELRG
ncbi:MAG: M3 family oligoendopeptidase [Gemmatimonadaceae bacterium]|nr:M3 family oligoendopeptidase [Gemmatimonadaceae bacterium]MDQ3517240.1 M3 family oligoendopeptidase [Gemmatimonadota bacterium]